MGKSLPDAHSPSSPRGVSQPLESLINLRRQIELHESILGPLQVVLHEQRGVWPETQLHITRQGRRLRKVHQVAQSERGGYWFMHCQGDPVLRLLCLPWLQHDIAAACVTLHTEGDSFLAGLHLHCLAKLLQIPTDLLELCGRQLSDDLVLLFWDLHVLTLDLHQLQIEVSDAV